MPRYTAKLDDGRTVTLEADEQPSEDDILSEIEGHQQQKRDELASKMQTARTEGKLAKAVDVGIDLLQRGAYTASQMDPLTVAGNLINPQHRAMLPPETARKVVDALKPWGATEAGSAKEGAEEFASDLLSGMSQPENAAALVLGKVNPKLAARLFQPSLIRGSGEAANRLAQSQTPSEASKALLETAMAVGGTLGIEKGEQAKAAPVPPPITGKSLRIAEGAEPADTTGGTLATQPPAELFKPTPPVKPKPAAPPPIVAAAWRDENGQWHDGPNHPEILKAQGKPVPPADKRNTPDFGYKLADGTYIGREEAGPHSKATNQNLKDFEPGEPVHSDEVAAVPGGKEPLSEVTPPTQTPVELKPGGKLPKAVKDEDGYYDADKQQHIQSALDSLPVGTRIIHQFTGDVYVKDRLGKWWHDPKDKTPGNGTTDAGQGGPLDLANAKIVSVGLSESKGVAAELSDLQAMEKRTPEQEARMQELLAKDKAQKNKEAWEAQFNADLEKEKTKGKGKDKVAEIVARPMGSTSLKEIQELSDEEITRLGRVKEETGRTRSLKVDGIIWGSKQSPELLPELERLAQEARSKERAAVEAKDYDVSFPHQVRATFYENAITGIKGTGPDYADLVESGHIKPTAPKPAEAPAALEPSAGTALKNAIAEVERASMGLPEATPTERRAMAQSWIRAGRTLEKDPKAGDVLVAELKENTRRGLTDDESAVLLRHKATVANELNSAAERTNTAKTDIERAMAQGEFDTARARFEEILDMAKKAGTRWGREGRWRQAIAKEDFSLETMTNRFRAEKGGRALTDSEQKEIIQLRNELVKTREMAEASESSKTKAEQALKEAFDRIEREPKIDPYIIQIAEQIGKKVHTAADAARERIKARMGSVTFGSGPLHEIPNIKDFAIIGAEHIYTVGLDAARWGAKMVEEFGEGIKKYLPEIFEASKKQVESIAGVGPAVMRKVLNKKASLEEQKTSLTERIKAKLETKRLDEVTPLVERLARVFSDQGIRGWRALTDAVHGVLKEIVPDLDYRETMDAISGHGKFRIPNQEEGARNLRDAKSQIQEVRKIQEVIAREPVRPTGLKRDFPSDVKRRLTQIYENVKRRFGVVVSDPATQLRSALQSRKTYYEHRIADLQAEINSRKRTVRTQAQSPTDPALEKLVAEYKVVKSAHEEVFGKRELTDAQKAELEVKSLDRQIAEVQRQLKEGDIFPESKKQRPTSIQIESKRTELEALKSERDYLRDSIQPKTTPEEIEINKIEKRREQLNAKLDEAERKINTGDIASKPKVGRPESTPELQAMRDELGQMNEMVAKLRAAVRPGLTDAQRLSALKANLNRRIADMTDRMARGDFSKRPAKAKLELDPETTRLMDEHLKVRDKWEKRLAQERLAQRTPTQRRWDMAVQWSRMAKLASFKVFPKLLNAALLRSVFEPISRVAGQPLRWIAPEVYNKARVEAGMSVESEAAYWRATITSFGKAWEKLRTGSTDIDRILGKSRIKPDMEMLNFVGNSHGMFKEPVRQATFERSKQLVSERMVRDGENPNDPLNTSQILSEAAEAADRNIFMRPNMVTRYLIKVPIAALKGSNVYGMSGLARTMEFLMPIVNVPSNIAAHTMRLNPVVGLTEAALRLRKASREGHLSNEDAESISRAFKLGLLGTVLAAYAWNNPDDFGGVYEEGRRKTGALKSGQVKIMGKAMPAFLAHAPEIMWLNTIASARRVRDRYVAKHSDAAIEADLDAAWFAVLAPVKNFPVIDNYIRVFSESRSLGRSAGAMIRDAIIPGSVTATEAALDPVTRHPQTGWQEIKMGIPGLRQEVPEKPKYKY